MKEIELTNGYKAIIDDENFKLLNQWKWSYHRIGYAIRKSNILMHRLIMNCPKNKTIDHINGNKLDNRKINLRICSLSENLKNQKLRINNTSGYKGVSFEKRRNKWRSQIKIGRQVKEIGQFKTAIQAAMAYDLWAKNIYGEYAKLNFERAI